MKFSELGKCNQGWCCEQVARNLDSEIRKVHSKANLAKSLNAAFRSEYGFWPSFTQDTIDTIIKRLKKTEGMEVRPDPNGKGVICIWGKRHNQTPAIVDHVSSIASMQKRAASLIQNQVTAPTIRLTIDFIPAAGLKPGEGQKVVATVEHGNQNLLESADDAMKASRVRYITKTVAVDEQGKEIAAQ